MQVNEIIIPHMYLVHASYIQRYALYMYLVHASYIQRYVLYMYLVHASYIQRYVLYMYLVHASYRDMCYTCTLSMRHTYIHKIFCICNIILYITMCITMSV